MSTHLLHEEDMSDLLDAILKKMEVTEEQAQSEGYDDGYSDGRNEHGELPMEALLERYNYLVMGGTFQLQEGTHPYLNGFMDAVTTLREVTK